MFRRLLSRLLHADLVPQVSWADIESMQFETTISVEAPRLLSRPEILEQVLCSSAQQYCLFTRRQTSGQLTRVCFGRDLLGREMRISQTAPQNCFRLQLWPVNPQSVSFVTSRPTWFRLWRNEQFDDLGAGICFIDSADRRQLEELRLRLLGGTIPESLQTEEEMWLRMNSMSEDDRRAALAALAMQQLGEVDRKFHEEFPDAGPVPDDLQPAVKMLQQRLQEIKGVAESRPVDPVTAALMNRFVTDINQQTRAKGADPESGEDKSTPAR